MGKLFVVIILVLAGYLAWLFYFKDNKNIKIPDVSSILNLKSGSLHMSDKWLENTVDAKKDAKSYKKPIFVLMTIGDGFSDLSAQFETQIMMDKEFSDYIKKRFVLVRLDYSPVKEKKKGDLQKQHDDSFAMMNSVQRYPTVIILNTEGIRVATMGYGMSDPWAAGPAAFAQELENRLKGAVDVPEYKDAVPATSAGSAPAATTSPGKISISTEEEPAAPAPTKAAATPKETPTPAAASTPPPAPEPAAAPAPAPAPTEGSKPTMIIEGY